MYIALSPRDMDSCVHYAPYDMSSSAHCLLSQFGKELQSIVTFWRQRSQVCCANHAILFPVSGDPSLAKILSFSAFLSTIAFFHHPCTRIIFQGRSRVYLRLSMYIAGHCQFVTFTYYGGLNTDILIFFSDPYHTRIHETTTITDFPRFS